MFPCRLAALPSRVPFSAWGGLRRGLATVSHRRHYGRAFVTVSGAMAVGGVAYTLRETDVMQQFRAELAQSQRDGGLSFRNTEVMYKSKSVWDLTKSLIMYQFCSLGWLVDHGDTLLKAFETLHISSPVYAVLRHTLFRYFCAGEDEQEMSDTMADMVRHDIRTIVGLSIEADEGVALDKQSWDYVVSKTIDAVHATATQQDCYLAIKLTAMGKLDTLARMTDRLNFLDNLFAAVDTKKTGKISLQEFTVGISKLGYKLSAEECARMFQRIDKQNLGLVDVFDLHAAFGLSDASPSPLFTKSVLGEAPQWTEADVADMDALLDRTSKICAVAKQKGVRLLVDAEQSYFQPGIDHVATTMAARYNRNCGHPIIYNTHQMYLNRAMGKLTREMDKAKREGWLFGAKLVRGAYMVGEHKRAVSHNLPSPVCDTKEKTDTNYNRGVAVVLEAMAKAPADTPMGLLVASHNEQSVLLAAQKAEALGILPESKALCFGQLYGMRDHITYSLAAWGYPVAKYIPYGPLRDCIPYLMRRAQENGSVLANLSNEKTLFKMELKRRLLGPLGTTEVTQRLS